MPSYYIMQQPKSKTGLFFLSKISQSIKKLKKDRNFDQTYFDT